MTTPPDGPDPQPGAESATVTDDGPRVSAGDVRDLSRLRRTVGPDRYVAGVGGGLARHLDVDPVVVRVALAVLAFFGGAGLLLYAVAWLVVPEDGADRARLSLDPRSRSVALVGTAVLAALALLGDTLGGNWFPWPLALLALLVFLLLSRRDRHGAEVAPSGAAPPSGLAAGAPPAPPASPTTEGSAASAETPPGTPWAGPTPPSPAPPRMPAPPPPNPRKRGPRLFPVTLALVAFAIGVLGTVDVAGAAVSPTAYPALALGLVAAMLLLASVWGRGGGLVALGLVAALVLGVVSGGERFDGARVVHRPATADEVRESYRLGVGEMLIDLRGVTDLDQLDGRTLDVSADVGSVDVLLPDGLDVEVTARTSGPGGLSLFGEDVGGVDVRSSAEHDGGPEAPLLTIDARIGVGDFEVRTP